MFNLTAIAEGGGVANNRREKNVNDKSLKLPILLFLSSFIVIFFLLYAGDQATSTKKKNYLVTSASSLVEEQKEVIAELSKYTFSHQFIKEAAVNLNYLNKIEERFPAITLVVRDTLKSKAVLLRFTEYPRLKEDDTEPKKIKYILSTSSGERDYLNAVFDGTTEDHYFSASDGRYELYFPI